MYARTLRKWVSRTIVLATIVSGSLALAQDGASELRIAIPGDGDTLDPAHLTYVNSFSIATNIYSGLVRYEPDGITLVPDLAESWETSEDGLVWDFHLRDGVIWQKGYGDFSAQDVVESFQRIMAPETGSRWRGELDILASIEALDDVTVRFTLKEPSAAFLHTISGFRQGLITNSKAVEDAGLDYGRSPVGTGPYQLEQWIPGTEIILTANNDYFLGAPEIQRIRFIVIADESVRMLALRNREVDIAMNLTNPEVKSALEQTPGIQLGNIATASSHGIMLNSSIQPFDDQRVRRALYHAIDREIIAEVIFGGLATPAYSVLAPPYLGHTADVQHYEYDPELARELLAEAGYPNGFKTTIYWLATHSNELLAALRSMWSDIGVTLEVASVDAGTWVNTMSTGEAPMMLQLVTRSDPHLLLMAYFHSANFPPAGGNTMFYGNVDDLIEAGASELDPERRAEIYGDIQRQVMLDLPYLPMYWPQHANPYWDYVQGWGGRQQYNAWAFNLSLNR